LRHAAALRWAFLGSLVLHVSVLVPFRFAAPSQELAGHVAGPAVMARIVSRPGDAQKESDLPAARVAPPRDEVTPMESEGDSRPKVARERTDPVNFRDSSRSTATGSAAVADSAPVAPARSAGSGGEAAVRLDEANPDGIRQYRLNLAREARRFKSYPGVARERGWEGDVVVVVNTVAGAQLPQVALGQSSGRALLDEEAVNLVEQAVRSATIPDSLRGRSFALTLPIQFRLDE
jgi:periplasmic protein TonB